MTSARRPVCRWGVAAWTLLLASCAAGRLDAVVVPRDGPLPARALGACATEAEERAPSDFSAAPIDTFLTPGRWLRVEAIDAAKARRGEARAFPGRYVLAGGDEALVRGQPATRDAWRLYGAQAKAAEAAVGGGAAVYVWTHGDAGGVAVALRGTDYAFLGECAYQRWTAALGLGRSSGAYLAAMTGRSSVEMRRLLGFPPDGPAGGFHDRVRRTLAPGVTPPAVLRGLRRGRLVARVPASWRGDALLCPGLYLGDGPCVDLRRPRPVTFYFEDDAELRFHVRTRDERGHGRPLGEVDPARLARRDRVALRDGVRVTVVLDDTVRLRDVLRRGWPRGARPIRSVVLGPP